MTVEPQDEQPRARRRPRASATPSRSRSATPRPRSTRSPASGCRAGAGGEPQASGLGVLFAGREPVAVRAAGGLRRGRRRLGAASTRRACARRSWSRCRRGRCPSPRRTAARASRSTSAPSPRRPSWTPRTRSRALGGMQGYEQLCRFTGSARVRGGERTVDCLGQRGHSWGEPDWDRLALTRTVGAWLGEDLGVSLAAVRPAKAKSHADEALAATLWTAPGDDVAPNGAGAARAQAVAIAEPRLSTTRRRRGPPAPRRPRAVRGPRGLRAPRRRRGRVRHVARPRPPAAGLRVLQLAARGPHGPRALRRAAAGMSERRRGRRGRGRRRESGGR